MWNGAAPAPTPDPAAHLLQKAWDPVVDERVAVLPVEVAVAWLRNLAAALAAHLLD